jgi:hypothetical protein
VAAAFDEQAVVDHDDAISGARRLQSMRNQ